MSLARTALPTSSARTAVLRWAAASALACLGTAAHAAVEELRFYAPGAAGIATQSGTPQAGASDLCTASADVCAATLGYTSSTAGLVKAYADAGAAPSPIVYQSVSTSFAGLGVALDQGPAGVSGHASVDQGESLTLLFAQPVEVVGFDFFDVNRQAFSPAAGSTIKLIVDEHSYTLNAGDTSLLSSLKGREFTLLGGATSYYLGAVRIAAVPEASSMMLMGLGLAGVAWAARARRRA